LQYSSGGEKYGWSAQDPPFFPPFHAHAWEFGRRVNGGWLRPSKTLYSLNLATHAGIIVGLSEKGIHLSQLRLAVNAARNGWKVVLFDPQSSPRKAAEFVAAMRLAGSPCTAYSQTGTALYRDTSDDCTNAVYLGFNVWQSATTESRDIAQALLSDFTQFLSASQAHHVLLLIEHPALLFNLEEIWPLFSLLEQAQGSLFVSARSVADFGKDAPKFLKNARTLIIHRSNTTLPFEPYVSLHWSRHHPFFDGSIRQFDHHDCCVIHAGQATHVRVTPVFPDTAGLVGAGVSPRPPTTSPGEELWPDNDVAEGQTAAFEPGDQGSPPPSAHHSPRRKRTRAVQVLSTDRAHLLSAFSFFDGQ
jgi:hypothetical protein